jgi:hypothetical protein
MRGFRLYRVGGLTTAGSGSYAIFKQLGRILAPHRLTDTFATGASRVHVLELRRKLRQDCAPPSVEDSACPEQTRTAGDNIITFGASKETFD